MDVSGNSKISIVIPTFNRGEVLIQTISDLIELPNSICSIIVVDQTLKHPKEVSTKLDRWHVDDIIDWVRLDEPSVVKAMNVGLARAKSDYILFLDDDIKPFKELVTSYLRHTAQPSSPLVAGRVVESWDDPLGDADNTSSNFSFNGLNNCKSLCFMGGNFLVHRQTAFKLGGFDENFVGTAHDYEREFSDRILSAGHDIDYCANAGIYHLKVESGGIRTYGHFLKTVKPHHAVGSYYYILTSRLVKNKFPRIIQRLKQRLITRTHLREPWWIPLTLIGDLLGLAWAIKLKISGPKHVDS